MREIWHFIKLTLRRLFVDPCYKCVREGDCSLYRKGGYCGDWTLCCYEEAKTKNPLQETEEKWKRFLDNNEENENA